MIKSTKIWTTTHRGIEIRFWQTDRRWFAVAPGQERELQGHSTLRAALQCAFEFVNGGSMLPFPLPAVSPPPLDQPLPQSARADSAEQMLLQSVAR
jgi:hypothetical protein